jgi:hypothetical protein
VAALLESELMKATAVVLIVTHEFIDSEDCRNDVSIASSCHKVQNLGHLIRSNLIFFKVLIPILCTKAMTWPPSLLEFALKDANYIDFTSSNKQHTSIRQIRKAIIEGTISNRIHHSATFYDCIRYYCFCERRRCKGIHDEECGKVD